MLSALALIALLNFAVSLISSATAARLLADLRLRIYEHLQSLPHEFHENHRQGDTLALMTYEIASLSHFLTGTLVNIPPLLLTVVGAVFLMFRIDPLLSLVVPILVPAFYLILKIVGRRLRGLAQALQQAEADVIGVFSSYDNIVDHCCLAWNRLVDQPWRIMTLGLRQWAHGF
ncbi:MAG: ABC transporter transmembrane domain-containing protein [Novosphingobium sp.]